MALDLLLSPLPKEWAQLNINTLVTEKSITVGSDLNVFGNENIQGNLVVLGTINGGALPPINTSLVPVTDNVYNLGSMLNRWHDEYLGGNLICNGNITTDTSNQSTTNYIVDPNSQLGTYTTIQSAINAANAQILLNPGLQIDILIHNGIYTEDIQLYGNINLTAFNQTPALIASTLVPYVTIKGQVTDTNVPPEGLVLSSGINFIDNGISPTLNLANAWLILNNCFIQTSDTTLPLVAIGLIGESYVQLQNCSVYGSYNNILGYCITIQDDAGIYPFLSNIYGEIRLNGISGFPYIFGGYNLFGSNQYGITINNPGANVEIFYNDLYSNLAFFNFLSPGTVNSNKDIYDTFDPSGFSAIGTGTLQVGNALFETNFGGGQGFSNTLTVTNLPQSDLSLSTIPLPTATTGDATLPANPVSFLPVQVNGVSYKIALYNP